MCQYGCGRCPHRPGSFDGIGFRSVTTDGYAGSREYGPSGVALGFCL